MTHVPGIPVKFDPPSEWVELRGTLCRSCASEHVKRRTHESSCGGYEDDEYECIDCGHAWWVDGIDS